MDNKKDLKGRTKISTLYKIRRSRTVWRSIEKETKFSWRVEHEKKRDSSVLTEP